MSWSVTSLATAEVASFLQLLHWMMDDQVRMTKMILCAIAVFSGGTEDTKSQRTISCSLCSKSLSRNDSVKRHMRRVHWKKQILEVCPHCSLAFKGDHAVELLKSHMKIDHEEDSTCSECKKKVDDRGEHMRARHTRYSCAYCGANCVGRLGLEEHVAQVHNSWEYSCRICGRKFGASSDMEEHMDEEHLRIGFSCDDCNEDSMDWVGFNHHMKVDHDGIAADLRSRCQLCDAPFASEEAVRNHMLEEHLMGGNSCRACKLPFQSENLLTSHMSANHVDYLFSCVCCEKTGKDGEQMWNHLMSHGDPGVVAFENLEAEIAPSSASGGVNRPECPVCSFSSCARKKSDRDSILRRHIRVAHTRSDGKGNPTSNSPPMELTENVSVNATDGSNAESIACLPTNSPGSSSDQSTIDPAAVSLPKVTETKPPAATADRKRKKGPEKDGKGGKPGTVKRAAHNMARGPERAAGHHK